MREAFLGKIIDLILSWGIFTFNNIKILCLKKQAQNVLEAKNGWEQAPCICSYRKL